jgi:EpsI family protein
MNKRIAIVVLVLLTTVGLRAYVAKVPHIPERRSLAEFPTQLDQYHVIAQYSISDDVNGILKADDTLSRAYRSDGAPLDLFIAYYKVQKAGESMHSPKNCLPGAGWRPIVNDTVSAGKDAQGRDLEINRYVIEKGEDRSLVLYWYQANGRMIANEYWGKFYLVYDALRTGRRDGALVRIIVPLHRQDDQKKALEQGLAFARSVMPQLPQYLPN